jgi:molecular chaperone GrpE
MDENRPEEPLEQDTVVTPEVIDATVHPDEPAATLEIPDDPEAAVPVLTEALMASREEASRYLDDYRRMAADFDNYRKRAQRDQRDMTERASERVVMSLLPVLDSFAAAITYEGETEGEQKLVDCMRGTFTQLLTVLESEGLEIIPTIGEEFDPAVHEAVQIAEGSGTMVVLGELRRGYRMKGRVIRAALVAVGYEGGDEAG